DFSGDFYYGFYDKANQSTRISQNMAGIDNDVDAFLPFMFQSANQQNELVGLCEAYEVKSWFGENPGKAADLPAHLQKLKNLEENDNPVVMIVKLKE
ncbi:MAG: hypothetical protein ACK5HT_00260, partial [Draconibacterium sp.]